MLIQQYTSTWVDDFIALKAAIEKVLEGIDHTIEHVGSTAVADLDAKPIIDIDVSMMPGRTLPAYSLCSKALDILTMETRGSLTGKFLNRPGIQPLKAWVRSSTTSMFARYIVRRWKDIFCPAIF